MNWARIFGNAGLTFFTTLASMSIAGLADNYAVALIAAFIQGGLAFFTEIKLEGEKPLIPTFTKNSKVVLLL
jgi:hypothetical protein